MRNETNKTAAFVGALWIAAAVIFVRSLPLDPGADWLDFAIFVFMAALAEKWYVATGQESGMSLSFTVHFAAAVLFGPAFAMVVVVSGLVITDGLIGRRALLRTAFNIAQMSVAVGLCGVVYQAMHVNGPIDLVADAPALAVAALVYLVVNDSLVAGVLSIRGRPFFQEWRLSFKDILLPYVSMAPLGALAAYAYQATPWALLYFVPLVLVVYNGFKLFVSLQHETDTALVALADSIDRRDKYTFEHSQRVADRVAATARELRLAPREIDLIAAAARVHDLGKMATDNRVLLKPAALTADERMLIEKHAIEGDEIAGKFSMFRRGRRFIRHHHERWDGTGYPDGLAGEQIPLGARIIAVADSFDAMTTDRPHRKALPVEVAVAELRNCAGTQFDPDVVRAFVETLGAPGATAATEPLPAVHPVRPWQPDDLVMELSRGRDTARLWAAASFTLSRLLDVPDCHVYRREDDGSLMCVASICEGEWYTEGLGAVVDLAARPTARAAISTRAAILISSPGDTRLGWTEREDMLRWNEKARVVVPLIVRDEVIGLVETGERREGRTLTPDQVATAESICQLTAIAIHDAESIEAQKLTSRRLASLLESSRAIATAKSSEDALATITRRAAELLDLTSCIAYEFDPERDAIVARAMWERQPSDWHRLGEPLPLAEIAVERDLLATGRLLLECRSDPDLDPVSRATMEMWGEKSCLTVPMQSIDGSMGLLTLWDATRERHYSDDELALASSMAELAGEAVRSAKLLRRLRSLSETDALTGLANRRKIHEFLAPVQAQAERYHTRFGLVMLDIDGFKALNDTHGHPIGDLVLRHVATILREQTRAADIVSRYGGDEFLLVLPETTKEDAIALAEKLRGAAAEAPCVTPSGEQIRVRSSFGVAAYPEDGRDVNDLIAAADANLYASKRGGGDAVSGCVQSLGRPLPTSIPA
jgi:diguanylate cyclase (GGDEF)-like protein/putative nucleotidyltransferase with HDIG domain